MGRLGAGVVVAGVAGVMAATVALSAAAAPPVDQRLAPGRHALGDDLPNAVEAKRRALREEGVQQVLEGSARVQHRGPSTVVAVGQAAAPADAAPEDQYVELAREKTDKVFVVLAEFGDQRRPDYPDRDTDPRTPGPARFDGPLHDQIPAPDRSRDNATVWQPHFSRDHFQQLYFGAGPGVESLKTYYERQSSGRYSVDGQVSDWVKVPYNEARYGRSNGYPCAGNVCSNTWSLIADALTAWVADQRAQGRSEDQIADDVRSYDQWDRYDHDGDGDFNEPDGYIDHFQIVHAGGDQADADPNQGEDAIWSHRWKAFQDQVGKAGPAGNLDGGVQIGSTGVWVADYTIQPENGGLSVFTHEYGHDLGLPDHYDTATRDDNAVNWWSLMAQSRVSAAEDQGVGTRPADLSAWDKLQLGWLDYEILGPRRSRTLDLGPHEYNSDKAQGVVVVLPPKGIVTPLGAPAAGTHQWWSGSGDDLTATMSRQVTLPVGSAMLGFQARWNIEDCGPDPCDYAYVEVDDGSGWTPIAGSITNPAEGNGIDGRSGGWVPATFDLSAYAGKTIGLRLRYSTDGAAQGTDPNAVAGLFVDELALTAGGQTVFTDGAESGAAGWTLDGFSDVGATRSTDYDNYYIASNRQYSSYDRYLRTGPYNLGFPTTRPRWAEHFPYQDGLLVSYWDTAFSDNNESQHPGQGEILPIDAHPSPIYRLDGKPWRGRVQTYDAPFSLERADSFTLHAQETGRASYIRGKAAQPVFDDRRSYWDAELPTVGVKLPGVGVVMRVLSQSGTSMRLEVDASAVPAQ